MIEIIVKLLGILLKKKLGILQKDNQSASKHIRKQLKVFISICSVIKQSSKKK